MANASPINVKGGTFKLIPHALFVKFKQEGHCVQMAG